LFSCFFRHHGSCEAAQTGPLDPLNLPFEQLESVKRNHGEAKEHLCA